MKKQDRPQSHSSSISARIGLKTNNPTSRSHFCSRRRHSNLCGFKTLVLFASLITLLIGNRSHTCTIGQALAFSQQPAGVVPSTRNKNRIGSLPSSWNLRGKQAPALFAFNNNNNNNDNKFNKNPFQTNNQVFFQTFPTQTQASQPPQPPPAPIYNTKDIVRRLQALAAGMIRQFTSGWMSGYFMGSIWSIIRGSSHTLAGAPRGMVWGMDFGVLSMLFGSSTPIIQFVWDVKSHLQRNTKSWQQNYFDKQANKKRGGTSSTTTSSSTSPFSDTPATNTASSSSLLLWTSVVRNVLLAMYFGRTGGAAQIIRSALLYGGMTYFFVGNKIKRDLSTTGTGTGTGTGNPFGNFDTMGNPSRSTATGNPPMNLSMLLQQMAAASAASKSSSSRKNSSQSQSSTSSSSSSSSSPKSPFRTSKSQSSRKNKQSPSKSSKPSLDNIVDVEFEKIETNHEDEETN